MHQERPAREGDAPGTVGSNGGALDRLFFACVGDTRPEVENDTAHYPSGVIGAIYTRIQRLSPRPYFAVATGDYVFASSTSAWGALQAEAQLDLYVRARAQFSGALFPALGNHECTGATSSNCGPAAVDGITPNYSAFLEKMLRPLQKSEPYYAIPIESTQGSWTAKLVVTAANAWSDAQNAWLDATLAQPTTYTFVVRHEPSDVNAAPGVVPSEAIMARHPYTLVLVGHSHSYAHDARTPRQVVIGNGGAPLSSKDYGFALLRQRDDDAIVVDMIDWRTGAADADFHFAVRPDGSPAPP